ncbi:NlpC/P60 family protein [Streptomyces polychromogenes]|uniref:NlpC/P60 family protein n=1 Tax=Streptomyces polychromogenes TaxID=67342 RepID=A0ABN0W433_9ACTN
MSPLSRRSSLAAMASAAVAGPLFSSIGTVRAATATEPAAATQGAQAVPTAAATATPAPGTAGLPEQVWYPQFKEAVLTAKALPGTPARLQVSDPYGVLATLTAGARTVTVRGPQRRFTEQKRPFIDRFDRKVENAGGEKPVDGDPGGWGPSIGGGNWAIDGFASLHSDYRVDGQSGRILLARDNRTRYVYLVDNDIADVNVTAVVGFSEAPSGAPLSIGLTCGFTDMNNHYRARIIVSPAPKAEVRLILEKAEQDLVTVLGGSAQADSVLLATGFTPADRWRIRLQREGHKLRASAWRASAAESTAKSVEATDARFAKGHVGVRALASVGSAGLPVDAIVDEFEVESCRWLKPPVVTHSTWVRILPAPFEGVWTPELEKQIRTWASDISPDALAYGSMFLGSVPAITSPALGGAQVLGQATYGPRDPDAPDSGRLDIGADFHDYMDRDWNFPTGEHGDKPEPKPGSDRPVGSLDCSGFVRMVFGYHMGMPMGLKQDPATYLPRTSHTMAVSGPGVIVAQSSAPPGAGKSNTSYDAVPPSITPGLQIGDTVYFNAEPPKKGDDRPDIDHVAIYLGTDQDGDHRFVSSRKTPDGPTMGDLAARSLLGVPDGGYYSRALRVIRRF